LRAAVCPPPQLSAKDRLLLEEVEGIVMKQIGGLRQEMKKEIGVLRQEMSTALGDMFHAEAGVGERRGLRKR